jgi:hypothetical protein
MSEPKFTKGPISVIPLGAPTNDWVGASFVLRAKDALGGTAAIMGGLGEKEERANAQLYAASPDLHESVRKAIQLASVAWDWDLEEVEIDGKMVRTHDLRDEFEAALKKAVPK